MSDVKLALQRLEQMVMHLYSLGDGRTGTASWKLQQAKTVGFIDACKLLKICSGEDIQSVIDKAHEATFGESRSERSVRLGDLEQHVELRDWEIFDAPTFERKK